jgi:hypothetical protein
MFIGHFGIGLAAKKPAKSISLGTLFLASQWLDLIWPLLVILNIERVEINPGDTIMTPLNFIDYPYSHSLVYVLGWSILIGIVYFLIKKNKRNALIVGLLVLSHWILDLFVHRPDLPILPAGPYVGFGLWNIPVIAVILELAIYISGIWLYASVTKAKDKIGKYALWSLVIFLAVIHIVNLTGPPPPDVKAIGYAGLAMWLIVIWAYWADKHREAK